MVMPACREDLNPSARYEPSRFRGDREGAPGNATAVSISGTGEPSIGPFSCLFRSLLQQRISRVVRMHIKNLEGYNACSLYESSC